MRLKKRLLSFSRRVHAFFFNDTATTEIYTLSLHDALPISGDLGLERDRLDHGPGERLAVGARDGPRDDVGRGADLRRRPARGNGHHQETQTPDQRSSGSHARVS